MSFSSSKASNLSLRCSSARSAALWNSSSGSFAPLRRMSAQALHSRLRLTYGGVPAEQVRWEGGVARTPYTQPTPAGVLQWQATSTRRCLRSRAATATLEACVSLLALASDQEVRACACVRAAGTSSAAPAACERGQLHKHLLATWSTRNVRSFIVSLL